MSRHRDVSSSYLRHQFRTARWRAVAALAVGIVAVVLVGGGLPARLATAPPLLVAVSLATLLIAPWIAFTIAWRGATRARRFRAGVRGEDALAQLLHRALNDDYTLYRNLRLPGWRSDLDAVLLGPPGLILLENKAYHGEFVLFGDRWYRATRPGSDDLQPWRGSPTAQAARNAGRLATWLARHGHADLPLHTLVVLSSGQVREQRRQPSVPVVTLDRLAVCLTALPRARRLDHARWQALAADLDALHAENAS